MFFLATGDVKFVFTIVSFEFFYLSILIPSDRFAL